MGIVERYFLWFLMYSFVGWAWECALCSTRERRFINRGFLNGPWCPIYGYGAVIDILVLGRVKSVVAIFFLSVVLTGVLEYFTSYFMEKIFHARWWDYSNRRFNINGRVCLIGMVVFGTFSVLLLKFLHPFVVSLTDKIPVVTMHVLVIALFVVYIVDNAITFTGILKLPEKIRKVAEYIKENGIVIGMRKEKDPDRKKAVEESRQKRRNLRAEKRITRQERRILTAFPKLRELFDGYLEKMKEIKEKLKK